MEVFFFGWWWTSHQSLAHKGLRIFRFCIMPWKDERETTIKYGMGRQIDELCNKVQEFLSKMSKPSEDFTGRIIFMSMFNDISWESKDNGQECIANATLGSLFAKRVPARRWSFLGLGSEKKWYSTYNKIQRGEWDRVAELMMIKFRESGHPVFRATSPLSRGTLKSKGGGKLSIHFCADGDTIETVFRTVISVNQLSIYGAVSDVCEEYSTCHDWTGRPVVAGQSYPLFVPSVMKTQHTIDRWSCTRRRTVAKISGTNWKVITIRQSD